MTRSRLALSIVSLLLVISVISGCTSRADRAPDSGGHLRIEPEKLAVERYERFQERVASEPGAVRTGTGLVYRELARGTGPSPRGSETVTVRYRTMNPEGEVVEDSAQYGSAVTVDLQQLRPCLREVLLRMQTGGTSRFLCPLPERGDPAAFPHAVAVDVTLLAIGEPLPPPGH